MNQQCERLHRAFHELDADGNGMLELDECRAALRAGQVSHLADDLPGVLARLGATNGQLGFEQFFEVCCILPELSGRELILTTAGLMPMAAPPPGTTAGMVLTAGFINGAISRTATAPFDRLRAVLATGRQPDLVSAARNMLRTQGLVGFWASNTANVIQVGPENAIAFGLNESLRPMLCRDQYNPSILEKFMVGSAAGALAMTAVYPMYVVQNRLAAAEPGQYRGTWHCIQKTAGGGWRGCYAGYGVSLLRVMPLKGTMLGGYATLKDLVKDPDTGAISTHQSLACSAAAGGLAHTLTYPMHLARTVLMQEVGAGGKQYDGFVDVLRQRLKLHGIRGWYAGLPVWLCNRIPAVAIEFAVNERALDALRWMRDHSL